MDFTLTQEQRMIHEYGDRISKKFDHDYWKGYANKGEWPAELYRPGKAWQNGGPIHRAPRSRGRA